MADDDRETMDDEVTDETVIPERDPEIAENDRFSVNGKAMPFDDWVATVMGPIAEREPAEPQPQPEPAPIDVVWMSRRPVEDR